MSSRVDQLVQQIQALPDVERQEFLLRLSNLELASEDEWDREIARDSQPGGRLSKVLQRVRQDVAEGRTKPLDEVVNDS